MDEFTKNVISSIVTIAKNRPMIKRMWLFGSRLKGNAKNNSDLDIAVEVEWVQGYMLGAGENDDFSLWCAASHHFKNQMESVCPWELDLQNYIDKDKTPNLYRYLKGKSKLIYEKT